MKLAFVIQRYGSEVAGGAEGHCRGLVAALRRNHEVEVLTTCALDYIRWANHYPPGQAVVDGVNVMRYPVTQQRDVRRFGKVSELVFYGEHTDDDERRWIVENGPVSPDLVAAVAARRDVDFFLFYSYRYYTAAVAAGTVKDRAILVPTAEDDPAVHLKIFADLFRGVRGFLFLTPEERELVQLASGSADTPSEIIGCGVTLPPIDRVSVARFELPESYLLYAGRIDPNKGVDTLLRYYEWLASEWPDVPPLVLVGHSVLDVPAHPKIRHLGYVSEAEKGALLAGASVVIMPSAFESLSILVLEAWALGAPVLVNARCRVLEGQCRRSGGGLYYRDFAEFRAMVRLLMSRPDLRRDLGVSGQAYVAREYSWDIAAERTNALLARLTSV